MRKLIFLLAIFVISSCGGGSGGGGSPAVPFAISIGLNTFSVDEDTNYTGDLNVSANEPSSFTYIISSSPQNGTLNLNTDGTFNYQPRANFNGTDQFQFTVTAVEKNITKDGTVSITVNPVNDTPMISFTNNITYSKETILFDSNQTFTISVDDIDNELEQLTFEVKLGNETLSAIFNPDSDYSTTMQGILSTDLSALQTAGLYNAELIVSDGTSTNSLTFESWFVSNKSTITIQQDDDPEEIENAQ